jgi:archaellin
MYLKVCDLGRKAEMGIGTLIIFIALLLSVAIAAGILIQSSGTLQERALTTSSEAKSQIATNIMLSEIFATDGRTGNLTKFVMTTKLSPGSEPIKFEDVMLTLGSYDTTSTIEFRGINGTNRKGATGYMTFYPEEIGDVPVYEDIVTTNIAQAPITLSVDLDRDGQPDTVETCRFATNCLSFLTDIAYDGQYLLFNLSTAGEIYLQMLKPDGTCCTDTRFVGNDYYGGHLNIHKDGTNYGTAFLYGQTAGSTTVHAANIRGLHREDTNR